MSHIAPGAALRLSAALHFAVANGNARATRALLAAGANPEAADHLNGANTPLHVAAQKGQTVLVEVLLDAGADPNVVNRRNETPLHASSANGHADAVTSLLNGGAWFNVENDKGEVAREVAAKAFSASNRVRARRGVLNAFKNFARFRQVSHGNDSLSSPSSGSSSPVAATGSSKRADNEMVAKAAQLRHLARTISPDLRRIFVSYCTTVADALSAIDTDGTGTITSVQLCNGLAGLGLELTEPEMNALLAVSGADSAGMVDYRSFVDQFVQLASSESEQRAAEEAADHEVAAVMAGGDPEHPTSSPYRLSSSGLSVSSSCSASDAPDAVDDASWPVDSDIRVLSIDSNRPESVDQDSQGYSDSASILTDSAEMLSLSSLSFESGNSLGRA